MILVDSTLYIEWLRTRKDFHILLKPWLRSDQIRICGIIRVEVVRGILAADQRKRVEEFFDLIPEIRIDESLWQQTALLAWRLDRKGIVLPTTDLVIAACALYVQACVITLDKHFEQIPDLLYRENLPSLW